ncbi:MAG: ParB/RepB/Spo0J family partition protein [Gilliamella sp.]|nr:ParB/RepB/Spo0J family partition protein [Gilliamella sp.]
MSKLLGNLKSVSSLLNNDNSDTEIWLDVNLIDPDPEQPRKYFDEQELQNLSASMTYINKKTGKQRGNKQAIIVRPNPENAGRYIIVMGERRWKAAVLGNMEKIRARIDSSYTDRDEIEDDQMIENIQSASLQPREIALWIGKKLKEGKKKGELAATLGKSNSYITQYSALLTLPGAISELFEKNKCNDVTLLNDLSALHKKYPDDVDNWIENETDVNRNSFKLFKEFLDTKQDEVESKGLTPEEKLTSEHKDDKENKPNKKFKPVLIVEYKGESAKLILDKEPEWSGLGWIKLINDDSEEFEVELKNVKLISINDN